MQQPATRPWITAGVALVGAGAIAGTPVTAPLPALSDLQSQAVQLTADGIDFLGAWGDVFKTASSNVTTLFDFFSKAPFAAPQQLIANQVGYLEDLFKGSTTIGDVFTDIKNNATDVFNAATLQGFTVADLSANPVPAALSNDAFHTLMLLVIPQQLPPDINPEEIFPLLAFLASPLSGVLIGELGPFISPWVALLNSITGIITALSASTPDWTTALQDLVNIPANMVGGFLNGAHLDLDGLLPLLSGFLPPDLGVTSLSYEFGGLLSPGVTTLGVGGDVNDPVASIGGSMLNSLGINLTGFGLDIQGHPVGPLGALENLGQIIAGALGWDGAGNPLADLFGAGGSAGAEAITPAIDAAFNSL